MERSTELLYPVQAQLGVSTTWLEPAAKAHRSVSLCPRFARALSEQVAVRSGGSHRCCQPKSLFCKALGCPSERRADFLPLWRVQGVAATAGKLRTADTSAVTCTAAFATDRTKLTGRPHCPKTAHRPAPAGRWPLSLPSADLRQRSDRALDFVELQKGANHYIATYCGVMESAT